MSKIKTFYKRIKMNSTETIVDHDQLTSLEAEGELWTIRQFCETHKWPSESAMRAYIYRADNLGLTAAFSRVGRRVLVCPNKFFSLIKKVNIDSEVSKRGVYAGQR